MSTIPFAATTPVSIGRVGLKARDGAGVADFYKSVLGLNELRRSGSVVGLGVGAREILEIEESTALREDDPRSAGLFHTAFLLPERVDLARWTQHAIDNRVSIDGASDHLVSEAIYLTDPEGNGIEIYVDRPKDRWEFDGSSIRMATDVLNFQDLMTEIDADTPPWSLAPANSVIGHVHLRVGDASTAEQWWKETQGFDTMAHYGNAAVFLSSGGYHHHIGANSWQSRGAGPRSGDRTGLGFVELLSRNASAEATSRDPWGNEVRVIPAA
jgi:catechol 2,3-dioxygenase